MLRNQNQNSNDINDPIVEPDKVNIFPNLPLDVTQIIATFFDINMVPGLKVSRKWYRFFTPSMEELKKKLQELSHKLTNHARFSFLYPNNNKLVVICLHDDVENFNKLFQNEEAMIWLEISLILGCKKIPTLLIELNACFRDLILISYFSFRSALSYFDLNSEASQTFLIAQKNEHH